MFYVKKFTQGKFQSVKKYYICPTCSDLPKSHLCILSACPLAVLELLYAHKLLQELTDKEGA